MISLPYAIIVIVATWILSAGITYGILRTKIDNITDRLDSHARDIEAIQREYVPRGEHNVGRQDIAARLERIERKIDALPQDVVGRR